jgi:hypothetical protein
MDRREFLKSTGAAAAAATAATTAVAQSSAAPSTTEGVAAPSLATGLKELRLATSWPDAVSGPVDQARRLGQRLTAARFWRPNVAAPSPATRSAYCASQAIPSAPASTGMDRQ